MSQWSPPTPDRNASSPDSGLSLSRNSSSASLSSTASADDEFYKVSRGLWTGVVAAFSCDSWSSVLVFTNVLNDIFFSSSAKRWIAEFPATPAQWFSTVTRPALTGFRQPPATCPSRFCPETLTWINSFWLAERRICQQAPWWFCVQFQARVLREITTTLKYNRGI